MQLQINTPFRTTLFSPFFAIVSLAAVLLLSACGGGGGGGGGGSACDAGTTGISDHDSCNSHTDARRGSDCMDCHTTGPGTGVFITSGTVSGGAGGYIEYYADIGRTDLRAQLQIDRNGNFYTVTAIDILTPNGSGFSPGGYVTVVMPNGSRRNMPGGISHTSASCNECHSGPGSQSSL